MATKSITRELKVTTKDRSKEIMNIFNPKAKAIKTSKIEINKKDFKFKML